MSILDPQRVALTEAALIEASAGTGKTFTIETLYLRLIVETGITVDRLLAVTFTRAATAELRERLRRRILTASELLESGSAGGQQIEDEPFLLAARDGAATETRRRLRAALHGFDQAAIFTIHGFCQRILREFAFESGAGFDFEIVADPAELLHDATCDFWVEKLHAADPALLAYLRRERIGIDALRALTQRTLTHPQIQVRPREAPADAPLDALLEAEAAVRHEAAAVWSSERDEILALLCDPALNKNKYRPKSIFDRWAPALDSAIVASRPFVSQRTICGEKLAATQIAQATKKGATPPAHPFFDVWERLLCAEQALADRLAHATRDLQREALHVIPQRFRESKRKARTLSFDDLLQDLATALAGPRGAQLAASVGNRYQAALIDEFQDTDSIQYEIFRRFFVAPGIPTFFVGDPKQAIYAFRGADIHAYLQAKSTTAMQQYTLNVNWRSDPSYVRALNVFFTSHPNPFLTDGIPYITVTPRSGAGERLVGGDAAALQFLCMGKNNDSSGSPPAESLSKDAAKSHASRGTAAEVARLLASDATLADPQPRRLQPNDIAVLCRTNAQVRLVRDELRRLGIPSTSQVSETVFESETAAAMQRVAQAMASPRDASARNAALATALIGADAAELDRMQRDEAAWEDCCNRFADLHERWARSGFLSAFQRLLHDNGVLARVLAGADGERNSTDLLHLAELMHKAEAAGHLRPHALLRWLATMRTDAHARERLLGEDAHIRLESDADAVQLVTIHKSKGSEFPIVFCPFLWDANLQRREEDHAAQFHDNNGELVMIIGSDAQSDTVKAKVRDEQRVENLRLLYVALTRAKHRCYVVWGNMNAFDSSPLGHFLGGEAAEFDAADAASTFLTGAEAHIDALLERGGGSIGARLLASDSVAPTEGPPATTRLRMAQTSRILRSSASLSSFTSLVAAGMAATAEAEGLDHDATDQSKGDIAATPTLADARLVRLHSFPVGRHAGNLLHKIFEVADFRRTGESEFVGDVERALRQHGFETRWAADLATAIARATTTSLLHDRGQLRLADVATSERLNELAFLVPAARDEYKGDARADALAAAFAQHARNSDVRDWAATLATRRIAPLAGYLKGFIDLVFRHEGRWFLADYKSNQLGAHADDYAPPRLAKAMATHDYFLQYHLYTVGLVRHLRRRLADFDYERDFGGAYYLFLRGMDPSHSLGTGVFYDRPDRALVEQLDAILTGGTS